MRFPSSPTYWIKQSLEPWEFLGFETRNRYVILGQGESVVGYAAEQSTGLIAFFMRQLLGHWRPFEIHLYDANRQKVGVAYHPFRFLFQRFEVRDASGRLLGALQQRFAFFSKRFDVEDGNGSLRMTMTSGLFRIWTFPFERNGQKVAEVRKRWGGILREAFTDKDKFELELFDASLSDADRALLIAAAMFIDVVFFEKKAQ